MQTLLKLLLMAILLFSFAGCQEMTNYTPETAALKNLTQQDQGGRFKIDAKTIQIIQKQEIQGHIFMIVGYSGFDTRISQNMACFDLKDIFKNRLGTWTSGGGSGSCTTQVVGQDEPPPFQVGVGHSQGQQPFTFDYTSVTGAVLKPEVKTLEITWQDGQTQQVENIGMTYMAIRPGKFNPSKVTALDEQGQAIHEQSLDITP